MRKKLLITASTFPRWNGDTEPRFILDYAKAMLNYYDVTVLVPSAPGAADREIIEGVKVVRFHYFPFHKWETLCYPGAIVPRVKEKKIRGLLTPFLFLSMKRQLKKWSAKVDLVHVHWIIPQGIMQRNIKSTPYLVTGHGGDVTSLNIPIVKKMKQTCLKNAIGMVGVSGYICQKMEALCPEKNAELISMGCDLSKFSPEKKKDTIYAKDTRNVLFVGRLAEKKGVTYLIEAMKNVDAHLYIVGGGPLEESLKKQAEPIKEKITFLGPKSHEELPCYYASADLFVAPSIVAADGDQEGLPVSIMEAMASGLPVVSGISGGTKDIIEDGINGFIVDAKNVPLLTEKINTILTNDELAEKMKVQAVKTSENYSYKVIAQKHYELIKRVLA